MARGKTRQQARGHKKEEHIERREKEREAYGLTQSEIRSIRTFCERYPNKDRDVDEVVDWYRELGYESFKTYRDTWNAARLQYQREQKAGTYASRGEGYLNYLTEQSEASSVEWLYYH